MPNRTALTIAIKNPALWTEIGVDIEDLAFKVSREVRDWIQRAFEGHPFNLCEIICGSEKTNDPTKPELAYLYFELKYEIPNIRWQRHTERFHMPETGSKFFAGPTVLRNIILAGFRNHLISNQITYSEYRKDIEAIAEQLDFERLITPKSKEELLSWVRQMDEDFNESLERNTLDRLAEDHGPTT